MSGSASAQVRIGVVGVTSYAETHIDRLSRHPQATIAALAGLDTSRARALADRYGASRVSGNYEDLLNPELVDAIVIIAPDPLHAVIANAAFEAGLHVMCEKPLGRTAREAREMAEVAEASGLVNMSYFNLRTSDHHQKLKELVADGFIGDIQEAEFSLAHDMFRSTEYNWRFDAAHGGGVIADLGCYLFDLARWYIGDVEAVVAHGRSFWNRRHPEGERFVPAHDSVVGAMTFTGGAHGTFYASVQDTVGPGFQRNVVRLQGTAGRLELTHNFAGAQLLAVREGSEEFEEIAVATDPAALAGDGAFIDAIVNRAQVAPCFRDGWQVQRCVEAASESAARGSWVRLEEIS